MADTQDVVLAQGGDKEAFIRLIRQAEATMYRVAKAMLRSDADCADAMQEAIVKAYDAIGGLREPQYFKTWLVRIVINQCKEIVRRQAKVVPMQELAERSQSTGEYERIELQEAVAALGEELRMVVTLYYFEDMPVREIAGLVDVPEGTVKTRLSRARHQLARFLSEGKERSVQS